MSQSHVVSLHPPRFLGDVEYEPGMGLRWNHIRISPWNPIEVPSEVPLNHQISPWNLQLGAGDLLIGPEAGRTGKLLTSGCQPPLTPRSKLFRFLLSLVFNSSYPGCWFQNVSNMAFMTSMSHMECHPNPIDELHHFSSWLLHHQADKLYESYV